MSNLRKYLKKRRYRERGQLISREEFGLLEKHKDYLARTKEEKNKKAVLNKLHKKADERNKDEFHFSMENERTRLGIPVSRKKILTKKEESNLKAYDLNYIQLKMQQEKQNIEKLKSTLHMLGYKTKRRHIIYVDDENEANEFSLKNYFKTSEEFLDRAYNRPTEEQIKNMQLNFNNENDLDEINNENIKQYKILNLRIERLRVLEKLYYQLMIKKRLVKGEECTKIKQSDGSVIYKWKMERKS